MLKSLSAVLTLVALASVPVAATAAPCRDAHGKFVKCPPATAHATVTTHTTTHVTTTGGKCRDTKGHFAKCGTPGAKPA